LENVQKSEHEVNRK